MADVHYITALAVTLYIQVGTSTSLVAAWMEAIPSMGVVSSLNATLAVLNFSSGL